MWVGMINLTFVLKSLMGCYYSNQLICGTFSKHRNWPPSAFALEFGNAVQYRHLHKGFKTGDDTSIPCKNLVNLIAVISQIPFLYMYLRIVIERKSAYNLHSSCWHFQTRWTIEMSMGAFKAAMDVYISYKFGVVLSSTSAVQQASISTWVNSSTFTRGQHVCASLLLVRERHCSAGRVIR